MQYIFVCNNPECVRFEKTFDIFAEIGTVIYKEVTCPDCRTNNIKRKWFSTPVIYNAEGFTKKAEEVKETKNDA